MEIKAARMLLVAASLALALLASACASSVGRVEQVGAAPAVVQANAAVTVAEDGDEADSDQSQAELEGDEKKRDDEGVQNARPPLATASAISRLSNQPGRAIVSARGNHFVVDSVPPLDGPNEELNPLDMMLSALASCGIFVAERAAQELEIPLEGATATVEGDFNPAGVATGDVNPRIQAFRVYLALPGASAEEAETLVEQFTARCPVYTTLSRAAEVTIFTDGEPGTVTTEGLVTATARAMLSNQPGRAIASARGNHSVVDSVPPLQGPNEERNPLDLMLGALATCGTFVYERVAQEEGMPLTAVAATVEGDFDPRGVAGAPVNPRIRKFRVHMALAGVDAADAALMEAEFQARCPIYTTLTRAAPIKITTALEE